MTKTKKLEYEKYIEQLVTRLAEYFNLAGWTIETEFDAPAKTDLGDGAYAYALVDSTYQRIKLFFTQKVREEYVSGDVYRPSEAAVHEMVHAFLDPFHEWALTYLSEANSPDFRRILEQQTQKLTMVFMKSLVSELGLKYGLNKYPR